MNRSDFIVRALRYYAESGFEGKIIVGDSSGPEHRARLEAFLASNRRRLDIAHVSCPELNDRQTMHRLASMVNTPYVAFTGDDDFLVTSGLEACACFLDANPDFVAANGLGWVFTVDSAPGLDSVYGRIELTERYPQPEFLQDTAAERFAAYMADYQLTLFSLHRASAWRDMWRDVLSLDDRSFGAELLVCTISPVLGRMKHLDCLYVLRQTHPRRYSLPPVASWVANPRWRHNYTLFRDLLAERLRAAAPLSVDEAAAFVEGAFEKGYLSRFSEREPGAAARQVQLAAAHSPAPGIGMFRRLARSIPGARPAFRALANAYRAIRVRSESPRQPDLAPPGFASPLREWLRPGSEHFAAFEPVHRIVSNPQTRETGQ